MKKRRQIGKFDANQIIARAGTQLLHITCVLNIPSKVTGTNII